MEEEVLIRCLEQDKSLVESVIAKCSEDYTKEVQSQLGEERKVKITIDTENFMRLRKVEDFTKTDIKEIGDEHNELIKILKSEDDQKW